MLLGSQWMRMGKTQKLQSHFKEFRSLAWEAANERACELGWVRNFGELHKVVRRTGMWASYKRGERHPAQYRGHGSKCHNSGSAQLVRRLCS